MLKIPRRRGTKLHHTTGNYRNLQKKILSAGIFDETWYLHANPDVASSNEGGLRHYIRYGMAENRAPSEKFDPLAYLKAYATDLGEETNAAEHYLANMSDPRYQAIPVCHDEPAEIVKQFNIYDAIKESGLFDAEWYRTRYADLKNVENLLGHFSDFGMKEGRDPGPDFRSRWYDEEYPRDREFVAFEHYIRFGQALGYLPKPANEFESWFKRNKALSDSDQRLLDAGPTWRETKPSRPLVIVFGVDDEATHGDAGFETIVVKTGHSLAAHTEALIAAAQGDRIIVLRDSSVRLSLDAATILPFYFDNRPALAYSDFIILEADGRRTPYFVPSAAKRYFKAKPEAVMAFAVNNISLHLEDLYKSDTIQAAFTAISSHEAVALRRVPHFLYSVSEEQHQAVARDAGDVLHAIVAKSEKPLVSIIIPTRNQVGMLKDCVDSVLNLTQYKGGFEIIIVNNGSDDAATIQYLTNINLSKIVRVLDFPQPFNYSAINNFASRQARGDILVFLNNDTIIIRADWLDLFAEQVMDPRVGVVGAKLLYPDQTVQHGGVVVGILGVAAHSHSYLPANAPGFQSESLILREVLAVTAACMAVRKDVFFSVAGFDTDFQVAFNDIALCVSVARSGHTNVVLAESIAIHLESKTRGYDVTAEKRLKFLEERKLFNELYWLSGASDPFYNPNLSIEKCYELGSPSRALKPWRLFSKATTTQKVLILSSTFAAGHGVAVVIAEQCRYLSTLDYEIVLGGPLSLNEIQIPGCERVMLPDEFAAANHAVRHGMDIIIAHTPPFFSIVRLLGDYPAVILYDYGEPPTSLFPDRYAREAVNQEKAFAFTMARHRAAISDAVRRENDTRSVVIPLANSHLGTWCPEDEDKRAATRETHGWENAFVVLCVCRFGVGERFYKGVDRFAEIAARLVMKHPHVVPVLVGKGTAQDAEVMRSRGLQVFANVTDAEMRDLYLAADAFVSLSQWEGYNLPIAQALALGVPVVASKIPAHDAFGIQTYTNEKDIVHALDRLIIEPRGHRQPTLWQWDESARAFGTYIVEAYASTKESVRTKLLAADPTSQSF